MAIHTALDPDQVLDPIEYDSSRAGRKRRGALGRLALSRVLAGVFVLWAAVTATFIAVHITPGDTVALLLGENRNNLEARASVIERWQLDQPIWSQYITYLKRIPSGDLGTSYTLRRPVGELIGEAMIPTFQLALTAIVVAVVLGFVLAYLTTARIPGLRSVASAVELVFLSAPPFWLAIVLLAIFSFGLGWFSVIDVHQWQALVLPVAAIGLPMGFYLAQVIREGIDRALEQPFALTARTRGISAGAVRRAHALRHAALPAVTLIGLIVGGLLGGAVIVETVFGRPGLGQLAVNAVTVKDVPLILGVSIVSTAAFVVASTAVDLVGIVLDPRLRGVAKH